MTSITIPLYNHARYIVAALDSIRAQTVSDWEAIVVDDCSTDTSRAVVQTYLDTHKDPRIRLIWPDKNRGVGPARNLGVAASSGDRLAFLDSDDFYLPTFLEELGSALDNSDAGLAFCPAILWSAENKSMGLFGPSAQQLQSCPASLHGGNYLNPSMLLCNRSTWERVGPFDTSPEMQHAEDWDWNLRAYENGVQFAFVDKPLVHWYQHGSNATSNLYKLNKRCLLLSNRYWSDPRNRNFKQPRRANILRTLAWFEFAQNPHRSMEYYREALRLEPRHLPVYARLAAAWLQHHGLGPCVPGFLRLPQ